MDIRSRGRIIGHHVKVFRVLGASIAFDGIATATMLGGAPGPALFEAMTSKLYDLAAVRPVTVSVVKFVVPKGVNCSARCHRGLAIL